MNIVITGAFGFVGSNLLDYLNTSVKHYLIAIDIFKSPNHLFDKYYSWNDLEKVKWNNTDVIIHLAGKAHDTSNTSLSQSYFDVNLDLTKKIFDRYLESESEKFIFFSSVKTIADTVSGSVLSEETIPNPKTPYGQSKLAAEQYILSKQLPANKKAYILRPCMIHGPGNKGNLNLLYNVVKKGLPWPLGRYNNSRSLLSIDNLIFVLEKLLENNIMPGVYQVADDTPVSTNEIVTLVAKSLGRKAKIWHIPKPIIKSFARLGDVLHLPLNSERLKKLTETYVVSNNKIKKALLINNMPISAKEGLLKTFNSFKG